MEHNTLEQHNITSEQFEDYREIITYLASKLALFFACRFL